METGLWGLFFALLTGMPGLAVRNPKLFRKISPLVGYPSLWLGLALMLYTMLVGTFYSALLPYIDPSKLSAASALRDSWLPDWRVIAGCFWFFAYTPVCLLVANRAES